VNRSPKSLHFLLAIACLAAITLCGAAVRWPAQVTADAAPQAAGDDLTDKVDALFADLAKPDSPGCALGVIRDGQLIYSKGYGQAVVEHSVPITARTVFDLGSVSKHFTASAIVLLAQQSKLSFDDDIRKYLPEMPDYSAKYGGKKITIRNLLHHTSGVRNYDTLMALAAIDFSGRTGDREAMDYIVRQKELNFAPGEEYLYSNSGYFLLSQIVKKASGKTLREFAAENIFAPLGMADTQYLDDTALIVPRRATGYSPRRGGGFEVEMSNFEQTGDGAVQTTVEDFLLWDRNFTSGRVLGAQGLQWLQTPGVLTSGRKITYAFGLQVSTYKGLPIVEHGGSWAGYRAHYARFPAQQFSVVCLCNAANANPSRRAHQVADVYLANLMQQPDVLAPAASAAGKPAPAANSAEWKKYEGLYRSIKEGAVLRVAIEEGKLRVKSGSQSFEISQVGDREFHLLQPGSNFRVRFEPASNGKFQMVRMNSEGTTSIYDAAEPFAPTTAQLRAFLGAYYSEEADVTYTIFEREGKLLVRIGKWTEQPLDPVFRDAFSYPMGQLEFTRNPAGAVTSFAVQAGRVRNIRFVRK